MAGGGGPAQLVTVLTALDKDGDGKVSKAELPERLQNLMATGDTNKDGFLDKAEIAKIAEARAGGGRGGPGRSRRGTWWSRTPRPARTRELNTGGLETHSRPVNL